MAWYVLYVKPRKELKTAEALQKIGVEVYCPTVTEVRQWTDRKKKVTVPVFTSYVFVNLPEAHRDLVFSVPWVVRYVFWLGKPAKVQDKEITTLKAYLEDDGVASVRLTHLEQGDRVAITQGAFKDHGGVVREAGKKRVRILLPHLGCVVNINLHHIAEMECG